MTSKELQLLTTSHHGHQRRLIHGPINSVCVRRKTRQDDGQSSWTHTWLIRESSCSLVSERSPSIGALAPKANSTSMRFSLPSKSGQGSSISLSEAIE